jgi:glycosyltransferase involved in cell wall biosynthesis
VSPRVSVCVCTFNGAGSVGRALESILGQTYPDFELVIVDDASSDSTLEVVRTYHDSRLRILVNGHNLGNARNRSLAIRESRTDMVKFVDQDDWIAPSCLAEHVRLMDANPRLGFTFSRRAVSLQEPGSRQARAWLQRYANVQSAFGELAEVNSGPRLLERYLEAGLPDNWIGEPSSVMIRRSCLVRSLLFNRRLRQMVDMDLWIRLMAFFDVGFLDAELATRWVGTTTDTHANRAARRDWLDRLWFLEGLRELTDLWERYPKLATMRITELKSLVVATITGRHRTVRSMDALADVLAYGGFFARDALGRRSSLFDRL